MSQPNPEAPLALDEERIRRVRGVFDAAEFTPAGILEHFGPSDAPIPRGDVPRLLRVCSPQEPFGALASLFLFGLAIEEPDLGHILGPEFVDDAAALGLLGQFPGGGLVGAFSVSAAGGVVLFQEASWSPSPPPPEMKVMAVSGSTRTAATLMIRQPVDSLLEIGTGGGFLAIVAASFARRVVATDCNPRALNMGAFSARFNGLTNIDFRAGDLFAPAMGEKFDRVVSNPPYVLTPPEPGKPRTMYRDSGLPADGMSEAVVRGLSRHLTPGGFGQSMINWAHVKGEDWRNRIRRWFQDSGCDVWLLQFETLAPGRYATSWIPKMPESEFGRYFRTFNDWMAYYDREGIEAVSSGFIVLRRREGGANWFAEDPCPPQVELCGEAVVRGFAARDYLTRPPTNDDLLNAAFRLAPEARRWTASRKPIPTGWEYQVSRLQLISGLAFSRDVDAEGMDLLGRLREGRTLRRALAEMAAESKKDLGWLTGGALPLVRSLIEFGMLLPPSE